MKMECKKLASGLLGLVMLAMPIKVPQSEINKEPHSQNLDINLDQNMVERKKELESLFKNPYKNLNQLSNILFGNCKSSNSKMGKAFYVYYDINPKSIEIVPVGSKEFVIAYRENLSNKQNYIVLPLESGKRVCDYFVQHEKAMLVKKTKTFDMLLDAAFRILGKNKQYKNLRNKLYYENR